MYNCGVLPKKGMTGTGDFRETEEYLACLIPICGLYIWSLESRSDKKSEIRLLVNSSLGGGRVCGRTIRTSAMNIYKIPWSLQSLIMTQLVVLFDAIQRSKCYLQGNQIETNVL